MGDKREMKQERGICVSVGGTRRGGLRGADTPPVGGAREGRAPGIVRAEVRIEDMTEGEATQQAQPRNGAARSCNTVCRHPFLDVLCDVPRTFAWWRYRGGILAT